MLIATIGGPQLKTFGAQIFVANLVVVGTMRDFSPLIIVIIFLFRNGTQYTDELSKVNKITKDVYASCNIRILALAIAAPLLCLFANYAAIGGGMLVGYLTLRIHTTRYWVQTLSAVTIVDVYIGLSKSIVFGIETALLSCFYGLVCQQKKMALGKAIVSTITIGISIALLSDTIIEMLISYTRI